MTRESINFHAIEKKWQKKWEISKAFKVKEGKKNKFYVLEMFPYPSASGLHMGHAFNYTIGDIYARYKRMSGFNVLYPMGFDSLGLPAENAAIKEGVSPKKFTEKAISNYIKQMKQLGLSYDWSRMQETHKPEYYKWDQWIFLKMYEKGLAYRKKAPVNWCPKCATALANEQVHNGKCWRHQDTNVEIKQLEQWFFKITDYAEQLYNDIGKLQDWPEDVKAMQKNWIGKSHGININFEISKSKDFDDDQKSNEKSKKISDINKEKWPIFTTRPDTIYGVTFMVISAQHPRLMELVTTENKHKIEEFLKKIKSTSEKEIEELEKEGIFTGSYAFNPLTNEKIPVYAGNFVLADYGSGMVMAVPAHDQRDFEFAKKYNISIKLVIQPITQELKPEKMSRAFTDEGILINSGKFTGMKSSQAIKAISDYLEKNNLGKRTIQYKLKDWLVSRQRYWGTPIPIIYCKDCGIVPVMEKELPVKLPEKVKFGEGNPLETNKKFTEVKCPKCGKKARRETDTMDTFVDSSWYFLRYTDPKNKKEIFEKKKAEYWMPIELYIGGREHACMHLIYFRFYTKFLRDLGLISFSEPSIKLFNQGMLHGEDGAVMSKSRGNAVLPEEVSDEYGIDTARLFLVSNSSPNKDIKWTTQGINGSMKFIMKVMNYFESVKIGKSNRKIESKLNRTIKEVTEDIEALRYNLTLIKIRDLFECLHPMESKEVLESFLKLLAPFCPHITEELWHKIGNKRLISLESWPKADERKIDKKLEQEEKIVEKIVEDINNVARLIREKEKHPKKVFIYTLPQEKSVYTENSDLIERKTNLKVEISAVNEKNKYDPKNKASKSKPEKPAIYLE